MSQAAVRLNTHNKKIVTTFSKISWKTYAEHFLEIPKNFPEDFQKSPVKL